MSRSINLWLRSRRVLQARSDGGTPPLPGGTKLRGFAHGNTTFVDRESSRSRSSCSFAVQQQYARAGSHVLLISLL